MKLSIIIVNYNVRYFLEQCLHSVYKAIQTIDSEVWVVDNHSVDGSCQMVKEKFPWVKLIENKNNTGFAVANNQAIRLSTGDLILLLNPDTVVQEDTFLKCCEFMDQHPDAGGLGVKMINGSGNFLPESKRALPTPWVAFYKIFGLSSLFPNSSKFGKYHLTYLDKDQIHEVDVLAGAFMLLRKETLDKTGLLDETFFMYGEDIDLSYRIVQAGYKNYYFPGTTIIHYKGESTKKSSVNYVIVFYKAMQIFAKKHFTSGNAFLYIFLINIAIWLRASISIFRRFLKSISIPLIDLSLIYLGMLLIKKYWAIYYFKANNYYPVELELYLLPLFTFIWVLAMSFTRAYEKPVRLIKLYQGLFFGTLVILALYSLLPEYLRFSRMVIIFGAIWCVITVSFTRLFYHLIRLDGYILRQWATKKIVIVAFPDEFDRIRQLLTQTSMNVEVIGQIIPEGNLDNQHFLGNLNEIQDIVEVFKPEEVIFCAKDTPASEIIESMLLLSNYDIEFKIAPPESASVIGSNSINTAGELYLIDTNSIAKISNRRKKRFFDIVVSTILLVLFPFLVFIIHSPKNAFRNIILVLTGIRSWVGFQKQLKPKITQLPDIKKGIFSPADFVKNDSTQDLKQKLNYFYAKDYKLSNDLNIILRNLLYIGKKI